MFSGNTLPFRAGFEAASIPGTSHKHNASDTYGEYYRVLKNVDVSTDDGSAMLTKVFDDALKSSPVVIRVKSYEPTHKGLRSLLQSLGALQNVRVDLP